MMLWQSGLLALVLNSSIATADVFTLGTNRNPQEKLSVTVPPLASLLLPGLDQWWEGQHSAAAVYSGTSVLGLGLAMNARIEQKLIEAKSFNDYDTHERQYAYGLQLYQTAGSLSAFHSFRTAARTRRDLGHFLFLPEHETSAEVLMAPFDFSQLARPTTYIPLVSLASVLLLTQSAKTNLQGDDFSFGAGVSYNAGVGEEAVFRGYIMPLIREGTGSDLWSNSITAGFFGLAHYSPENRFPIIPAAMGWYLGWLTQRNGWSLRQAVFLHTWWDILAIGFALTESDQGSQKIVRLPTFTYSF